MEDRRTETTLADRRVLAGPEPVDPVLLAGARAGDPGALEVIFREHGSRMLAVAERITGSPDDAQDVVQDIFVGLPEALRGFDGSGVLAAWLRRLTARASLLRLRTEKRRTKWHRRAVHEGPRSQRPTAVEARLTLERVLDRMPRELRVVYVLKDVEGYAHSDIASMLGISSGASEVRLHRARRFLKDRLAGRL